MAQGWRQLFPRPMWLKEIGLPEAFSHWFLLAWNVIGQVEEWHEVGGTNEPAFENSWANVGGNYETAAFYKDPFGVVRLKGMVDSGTNNTAAFTLPVGYRPAAYLRFEASQTSNARVIIEVRGDGSVIPVTGTTNGAGLEAVSFRAEQ